MKSKKTQIMTSLFSDQKKAIEKLSKTKVGAIFMQPGTGKTRIAIELVKTTKSDLVLWICPFQVKSEAQKELAKWELDAFVVGIESIQQSDNEYYNCIDLLESSQNAFIVLDESIKIKNSQAKRTKRILVLSKLSQYRLILNGTPLSKNLMDLYTQFAFLSPKILKMSEQEFQDISCEYVQIKDKLKKKPDLTIIKKYHNIDYLIKLIWPFVFESNLSLSVGMQHIVVDFKLSEEEQENHKQLKEKLLDSEALWLKDNNVFMELTQKMQQNYSLSKDKFRKLDLLLKDIDKSKVLIFAKYIKAQQELTERYPDLKILSYQKHSFGLNLQDYNVIVFWEKTWDYAQREQAEKRIYRTGQTKYCLFYDFTGNVGLEKIIDDCIYHKRKLIEVFSNHEL